jgi:DNA invertase Pin-like site-specific DNA recombinase
MSPVNPRKPLVPYVRQSRKKEKTISLDDQRRSIKKWAEAAGVTLASEIVEQGVSGSKSWRERELGRAVDACERGEASGIIVAFQDRLSRENGLATAEVWQALDHCGARLVCSSEGLDTATGDHEMLFTIKAAIAREQWKRHKLNWRNAGIAATRRGVQIGRAPAGYVKDKDGRLVEHPVYGQVIRNAFELRAAGKPWSDIVDLLNAHEVPTAKGSPKWAYSSASALIACKTYLGRTRIRFEDGAEYQADDEHTHEPLVTGAVFRAAQAKKSTKPVVHERNGTKKEPALLAGFLRCGTCGHRLTPDTARSGSYMTFRCKNQGNCDAKVSIGGNRVQEYVLAELCEHAERGGFNVTVTEEEEGGFDDAVAEAEAALQEVEDARAAGELSPLAYGKALDMATAALEAAESAQAAEAGPSTVLLRQCLTSDGIAEFIANATREAQREIVGVFIEQCTVLPAKTKGAPVDSRVQIAWLR